jgi:WD40 repeat protein/3',5'-cyclic AMP phosphodiesterase CpdA
MANETVGAALPPDAFVVRVLRPDGRIAGIGIAVGGQRIVTCAHVVNAAIGQELLSQNHPDGTVLVDFPYAAPAVDPMRAKVVAWVPPPRPGAAGDDIAGLLLDGDLPAGITPAKLGIEPARAGQPVRVFGYLDEQGSWVATTVRGRTGGKLRLDSAQRMDATFSGSPLFDDTLGRVVGMIIEIPPRSTPERDAHAIDAERLRLSWPTAIRARPGRGDDVRRHQLTILHVSDTQFGKDYLFGGNGLIPADGADASLFDRLHQDLAWLREESGLNPDLIVVTGDLAESGLRSEFARASRFLAALAEAAEVPRKHVAIVPGNNDVNQRACLAYFADAFASEEEPVAPYFPKWRDYVAAFEDFYAGVPGATFTPDEPWTLFEMPDLRVVVAGLNSTMAQSHLDDDQYGRVGERQLRWFARRLEAYRAQGWLRLAAVHHNVARGALLADENLRDAGDLDQVLGADQLVNLLLHGHTHDARLHDLASGLPVLSTGSAAVPAAARPAEVPGQYQLITVSRARFTRYARQYAPGQRRWIGDTRISASGSDWRELRSYEFSRVAAALPPPPPEPGSRAPDPYRPRSPKAGTAGRDLYMAGRDIYVNAPAGGSQASDTFLSRAAEATRVRFQGKASVSERTRDGCDYLRVSCPVESGAAEVWPVGVIDGPVTEAGLSAFVEHVHAPFAAADPQVPSELVYAGPAAPAVLVARARRLGVRLRSFIEYQGLLDLGPLAEKQRERLAGDSVYPERLYVEQRFRTADGAEVRSGLIDQAVDWLSADGARLIVVLGDFGRGKTSFLRQLTRRLPEELPGVLPILVELRTLEKAPSLDALLAQHLINQGVEDVNPKKLDYMIRTGRVALLFDGFDELELRVGYDNAADYLQTLLDSVTGRAKVILTSRTQHFRSTEQVKTALGARVETRAGSRMVVLEDFSEEQILRFLVNLYRDEARARARFDLISDIENLLALAHNPRMLTFVAAMDDEQLRGIPRREGRITQAGLYQSIIEFWLEGEARRQAHGAGLQSFGKDERLRACTALALRLWGSTKPTIALNELSAEVTATLTDLAERGYSAEQATHSIASGSLLVRTDDGAFAFIHQSIMEWLVAAAAAADPGTKFLAMRQMSRLMADFFIDLTDPSLAMARVSDILADPHVSQAARQNALTIASRLTTTGLLAGQDLTGADLRGLDLTDADLHGTVLAGANLSGMRLAGIDFTAANLIAAIMAGVRMTGGSLHGADLTGSRWDRAAIMGTAGAAEAATPELGAAAVAGRDPAETIVRPWFTPSSVAFSPDGTLLAIGSSTVVEMARVPDGRVIRVLHGHTDAVNAVAFSPHGTLLASASNDETVRVWDVDTGALRAILSGHEGSVYTVAFSPDSTLLATAAHDHSARVWDAATGELRATLTRHEGPVSAVAFSPDGTLLATASSDRTARVWDAATGMPRSTLTGHEGPVQAVAFSPDGTLLATASSDRTARVWDAATGTPRTTLTGHDDALRALAFSPDGALLATVSADTTVRTWETATGSPGSTLTGHGASVRAVAFSPDGALIATVSADGTLFAWDAATGNPRFLLHGHDDRVYGAAFSPDGALIATVSADGVLRVWDAATGTPRAMLTGHDDWVRGVAFSPDGTLLATGSYDNTARVWDAATCELRATLTGHELPVRAVAFSPDGALLATASNDRTARIWDAATGTPRATLAGHDDFVYAVAFSPDGTLLATSCGDGGVRVWDAVTETLRTTLTAGPADHQYAVAFSPDGTCLATSSEHNTARVWNVATREVSATLTGHNGPVRAVAFSPDGALLATSSEDSTARIWDAGTGTLRATLTGHGDVVYTVAFSADGALLATGSADNTARIWDAAGTHLATLVSLPDGGYATLLPDGSYKLDGDPTDRVWWAIKLCRFEAGELDPHVPGIRRLPPEAPILPPR